MQCWPQRFWEGTPIAESLECRRHLEVLLSGACQVGHKEKLQLAISVTFMQTFSVAVLSEKSLFMQVNKVGITGRPHHFALAQSILCRTPALSNWGASPGQGVRNRHRVKLQRHPGAVAA